MDDVIARYCMLPRLGDAMSNDREIARPAKSDFMLEFKIYVTALFLHWAQFESGTVC